jgi:hypothetical protein
LHVADSSHHGFLGFRYGAGGSSARRKRDAFVSGADFDVLGTDTATGVEVSTGDGFINRLTVKPIMIATTMTAIPIAA